MTTEIFYFSGTGNTLALTKKLAAKIGDCTVTPITACRKKPVKIVTPCIGIAFPVYAWGMPRIVAKFVSELEIPSDAYIFSVCDSAGMPGCAQIELNKALQRQGRKLNCGFALTMPSNYIPFGGPGSPEKQRKHFARAEARLDKIAENIGKLQNANLEKTPCMPYFINKLVHKLFLRCLLKDARKFYVNDKCISCGICTRVCPNANIIMQEKHPIWGDNCEQCLACIQWCPEKASQIKGQAENKPRYTHPEIQLDEMFTANHQRTLDE